MRAAEESERGEGGLVNFFKLSPRRTQGRQAKKEGEEKMEAGPFAFAVHPAERENRHE